MERLKAHLPKALEYGTMSGVAYSIIKPETLGFLFGHAFEDSVLKASLAFILAAWIHAGRVKKEIHIMAEALKKSIDNVADALHADLEKQALRTDKLENGFEKLNTRVEALETNIKGG